MRNKDFGTRLRGAVCTAATVAAAAILIAGCGVKGSAQAAACRSRRHAITQRAAGAAAGSDACRATRHIASTGRPAQAVIAFSLSRGELHAERVSLATIAERFGTPCYVYSRAGARSELRHFRRRVCRHSAPRLLRDEGELQPRHPESAGTARLGLRHRVRRRARARDRGRAAKPQRRCSPAVGKSALEMEAALAAGIRCFNVESAAELEV
jgi:hypothetical protein